MTKEEAKELGFKIIDLSEMIGDHVVCDLCNEDYTESPELGGVLFNRTACCPECAEQIIKSAHAYNEEKYLTYPNEGETFYNFILRIR